MSVIDNQNSVWQSLNWDCHPNIRAGFTLKNTQFPQSFNLAKHVFNEHEQQNSIAEVDNNRQYLICQQKLTKPIIWLNQIHSNHCVEANVQNIGVNADASYTRLNESICAVLTADCLPIFLADKNGKEVAIIHGGWRGLLNGVIEQSLALFKTKHIQAYLGAAIGVNAFEVGIDVRNQFIEKSPQFQTAFAAEHSPGKTMANIYQIAHVILIQNQITDITCEQFCTVTDPKLFSYRQGDKTGRMAHFIWLKQKN
ncbi:peptidoglycan editing factor PgeF [Marinicellulosiphila megalodicopiae]|uniref:peptidoglycan editing factor PgeF n=1 Tax=Marinicellulosiphila megalodicopiae TaxID=2724896 RepID=UPI003BAFE407